MAGLADSFLAKQDAETSVDPTPGQLYNYFVTVKGADPKVALGLTAQAAAESGLHSQIYHDRDANGNPTGFGLWGHRAERWDAMAQAEGSKTPSWPQQADFAYNEAVERGDAAKMAVSQSPEQLTAAGMSFERPQGWSADNPQAGMGWNQRLGYATQFAPLLQGQDVKFTGPAYGSVGGYGSAGGQGGVTPASLPPSQGNQNASLSAAFLADMANQATTGQTPAPAPAPQLPVGTGQVAQTSQTAQTQTQNPNWGPFREMASAALLGYGPQFAARMDQLQAQMHGGQPISDEARQQAALDYTNAQAQWKHEHPLLGTGADVVGTLPTFALGMGGLGALGRGVGAGIKALAPSLASAVSAAGEFLGGSAGTMGSATRLSSPLLNVPLQAGSLAASGALQGELSGAIQNGGWPGDWQRDAMAGAGANMLLGPLANRLNAPLQASVEAPVKTTAQSMLDQGVPVYGGQVLPNSETKNLAMGAITPEMKQTQLDALTRGLAKSTSQGQIVGADQVMDQLGVKGLTPAVIDQTKQNIGDTLDNVAKNTTLQFGNPELQALKDLRDKVTQDGTILKPNGKVSYTPESGQVLGVINRIETKVLQNGFTLPGEDYQDFTQTGGVLSKLMKNPNTRDEGLQLKNLLDQTLESSASPEYKGVTAQAREAWKNVNFAEDVTNGSTTGTVDPAALARRAKSYPYPLSPDIQALAGAKNLGFATPGGAGGIAGQPPKPGMLSQLTHSPLGASGLALGAYELGSNALEHGHALISALAGDPFATMGGIAAAGVPLAVGAVNQMKRNALLRSPEYTNMLLQGVKPQVGPNWATPLATQLYGSQNQ